MVWKPLSEPTPSLRLSKGKDESKGKRQSKGKGESKAKAERKGKGKGKGKGEGLSQGNRGKRKGGITTDPCPGAQETDTDDEDDEEEEEEEGEGVHQKITWKYCYTVIEDIPQVGQVPRDAESGIQTSTIKESTRV
ncbi:hypothetical protein HD553DRAFT_344384 [Filobasidium floriforme]|uniref:uncharacterized protein n=1 Tax=Filobasidium floriforme TaxID=5210 RepID=UPI001E8E3385|nr:uncharacterized protein HD553DRAFT_344384 [Filobasidium floriforme]KAH8081169.1 hypothetical protein HD553DRAFT_344384 [Filobasidium floriforme]